MKMGIVQKWTALVFKTATGGIKQKLLLAPVTGVLYLLFIALCIFVSIRIDALLGLPVNILGHVKYALGLPVVVFGFFLMLFSLFYFLKVKGTPVPFSPPPVLVITGPYKYARNPMLTGIFLQLFGLGILLGSFSLLFIFTPLFIAINVWELKKVEEPELEKRLGDEYKEYKKKVPMFFPWLK